MSNRLLLGDDVLVGTAAGAGTFVSLPLNAGGGVADVLLLVHVTAAGGTTPSLTVALEQSNDGVTWTAIPGSAAAAMTAVGNTLTNAHVSQNFARVTATITGTTPTVTYRVSAVVFAG